MNVRRWIGAAIAVSLATISLPAASASASAAMPLAKPVAGHDARHAIHAKRAYAKHWRYRGNYGIYYARPKPYTYIYRYHPYVYHRPRVYVRPELRSAHHRRYWPRKLWRQRYDRRPGVHYYHH